MAGSQGGTFSAAEAQPVGVRPSDLKTAVLAGDLLRVRRGAYVDGLRWRGAGPEERYRLAVTAIARTRPEDALSHHAALAVRGLPLWAYDAERVDLVSDVAQGVRRDRLLLHRAAGVPIETVGGLGVVRAARAVVRTALTMGRDCAVVAGDAALHAGLVTTAELLAEVALVTPHEGRQRALEAVLQMDGKAESVGESRTRLVLADLNLMWESQVVITDASGRFVARVDFLVEGVVLEFDGRVKYERQQDDEEQTVQPGRVVWLEKQREDRIRRLGYPVERVVWDELDRPGLIGGRLREARSAVRMQPPRNTPRNSQHTG
jgi:hypothetical protein